MTANFLYFSGKNMSSLTELISKRRERVLASYKEAEINNYELFHNGDVKGTSEYIYPNQKEDANKIVDIFYKTNCRVISIQKKTKVGADGLMIEVAKLLTTHIDDNFVVNPANVRILTGMSNVTWEKDMIDKAPYCFKDKIFHHGKLSSRADLTNISNGLFIIDEVDVGDKEYQLLHTILETAGVLDVKHMEEHNNRFVFISATMIKQQYDLYRWGKLHEHYKMTIPESYFGHKDFLENGSVKEFYSLNSKENAEKWIQEDILNNYGTDYRINIVRVIAKTVDLVQNACILKGVAFRNHTSIDRLSDDEINEFFKEPLKRHIVLGVKGFYRRANLIPNPWKLRIGATHELYTKNVDYNVQIQGLTGRMTGYWRENIEAGHKTGPHRTSIKAIEQYEKTYLNPFGLNSYQTSGFKKNEKGKVIAESTMLSARNIPNLEAVDLPVVPDVKVDINLYRIYSDESVVINVCKLLGYQYISIKENNNGFKETSLNNKTNVVSLQDAIKKVPTAYGTNNGIKTYRTYYPCYEDTTKRDTLRFVVIIRPETDKDKIKGCDAKYPSLIL